MKILIAYYSLGGSTKMVADALEDLLIFDGHQVDIELVQPTESRSSWMWFFLRSFKNTCPIQSLKITDVSSYDLICVGSPNWTKLSLPMGEYLRKVHGLKYKNVALFSTSAFIPIIEWYFLSAYFLDSTFTNALSGRNARNIGNVLFSSIFSYWNVNSSWGKEKLKIFVKHVTQSPDKLKQYTLYQRERESVRLMAVLFPVFVASLCVFLIVFNYYDRSLPLKLTLTLVLASGVVSIFQLLTFLSQEKLVFLGKYFSGAWLVFLWTVVMLNLSPELGRTILGGYILILAFMSIFRHTGTIFVTGIIQLIGIILLYNLLPPNVIRLFLDVPIIVISMIMIGLITRSLENNTDKLLQIQEDLDEARINVEKNYAGLQQATDAYKKEKDKTAIILSHLADGVLVFDSHKDLIYANRQAISFITGKKISVDSIGEKELEILKNEPNMEKIFNMVTNSISNSEVSFLGDKTYEISIEPVRLEENGPYVLMVDLHDITEEKELDAMKVDFASIAAHELRTPITTIRGYLSLLQEEAQDLLKKDNAIFLSRAVESASRLNATVESLLAVTRVEKGQSVLNKGKIQLQTVLIEVIDELMPAASDKNQSITFHAPENEIAPVIADSLKVKEIIVNLITNAIKYTQLGGEINVYIEEQEKFVQVHIQDNGPGISDKTQKFLFRKFLRGDNPLTEQTQGVGLGLYLVKSLVELQGGSIWVKSKEKEGTTFSFSLPKYIKEIGTILDD